MIKKNKYVIGKDAYGNSIYDFGKVLKDFQKMFKMEHKKFPLTDALYDVMYTKFTPAFYDKIGWFSTYNGKWENLAAQIDDYFKMRKINPNFESENPTFNELDKLISLLCQNDEKEIDFPMIQIFEDNGRISRWVPKMK